MEPIIEFENFTFKYRSQMEPTLPGNQFENLSRREGAHHWTIGIREVDHYKLYQRI